MKLKSRRPSNLRSTRRGIRNAKPKRVHLKRGVARSAKQPKRG